MRLRPRNEVRVLLPLWVLLPSAVAEAREPKIFTPEITVPHLPKAYDDLYQVNRKEGRFH